MAMSPVGLEIKKHCAGERQQQFTGLDWTAQPRIVVRQRLGKQFPKVMQNCWRPPILCGSVVSKEIRRLVLTSLNNILRI
jgi:hypothetical protein